MAADGSTFTPDRQAILAASIRAALIETGRTLPADDLIASAASALAPSGDLELAIQFAGFGIKQGPSAAYPVLLAYEQALAEIADPTRRVARLRREDASLRNDSEYHARIASEFHGKAAYRTEQGEAELAAGYLAQAQASDRLSAEKLAAAAAKSDEADDLAARLARTADLMMVVA